MTAVTPSAVTPDALAAVLADDKVIAATRKLIAAEIRSLEARRLPTTNGNEELARRTACWSADRDARMAGEDLAEATQRAAERLARETLA